MKKKKNKKLEAFIQKTKLFLFEERQFFFFFFLLIFQHFLIISASSYGRRLWKYEGKKYAAKRREKNYNKVTKNFLTSFFHNFIFSFQSNIPKKYYFIHSKLIKLTIFLYILVDLILAFFFFFFLITFPFSYGKERYRRAIFPSCLQSKRDLFLFFSSLQNRWFNNNNLSRATIQPVKHHFRMELHRYKWLYNEQQGISIRSCPQYILYPILIPIIIFIFGLIFTK